MRQAGRSLPEYREVRRRHSILEVCRTPELTAEVTLQPVRRLGVDAAILFSDIVVPLEAMGVELEIAEGVGPVIAEPVRGPGDLQRVHQLEPERDVPYVLEAVRALSAELEVPLIGFAGAPFTLASYLIEGGPSRSHARTKALMFGNLGLWTSLMELLADSMAAYLNAQVRCGAAAVQVFDSWAGALAPDDYATFVLPGVRRLLGGLEELDVPRVLFGVGTGELLELFAGTGAEVVGVDWRVPLDAARRRVGPAVALQGNLDPAACLAPWEVVAAKADDVLRRSGGRAHVFNLGHGVLPETDPAVLGRLVEHVHERGAA